MYLCLYYKGWLPVLSSGRAGIFYFGKKSALGARFLEEVVCKRATFGGVPPIIVRRDAEWQIIHQTMGSTSGSRGTISCGQISTRISPKSTRPSKWHLIIYESLKVLYREKLLVRS